MKHNILKIVLLGIVSFLAFACDSDEGEVDYAEGNSYPSLRESTISLFDINELLTFDVFVEPNALLSELEIYKDDIKIADGDLSEGTVAESTATFNSSSLLPFDFDDDDETGTFDLTVFSTGTNGDVGRTFLSIDVKKPLSFSQEVSSVVYGDSTNATDEDGELIEDDKVIIFEVFTIGATVDDISLFWKNGVDGTYVQDESIAFTEEGGQIDLKELDYIDDYGLVAGDTLFYQIIATSGDLTDIIETSISLEE